MPRAQVGDIVSVAALESWKINPPFEVVEYVVEFWKGFALLPVCTYSFSCRFISTVMSRAQLGDIVSVAALESWKINPPFEVVE